MFLHQVQIGTVFFPSLPSSVQKQEQRHFSWLLDIFGTRLKAISFHWLSQQVVQTNYLSLFTGLDVTGSNGMLGNKDRNLFCWALILDTIFPK